jgi:hypothetical protein
VNFMMLLLLMAGIGALMGGLVAILFGIPVKEFSFGNTLIVVGAMAACTGLIIIALSVVVGELKTIARRLPARSPADARSTAALGPPATEQAEDDFMFPRDQSVPSDVDNLETRTPPSPAPTGWNGAGPSRVSAEEQPEMDDTSPAAKPRRNLMFASASRKERERAQARSTDVPAPVPPPLPPIADADEPTPYFEDAWPKPGRMRGGEGPPQRRAGGRMPPSFAEPNDSAAIAATRTSDRQTVTVLKSGVVDGMAYSLYSDGSIEAELPEGTMRFGSIDELRTHLDQRSG